LSKEEIDRYTRETHYDSKELRAIYKQFTTDAPEGFIRKEDFVRTMRQMGVKDAFLHDLVFNAFDFNKDGNISFNEFIVSLSIMTRGDAQEKLDFAFKMYDVNHDGHISRDEMIQIMESFYKLVGGLVTFSGEKYDTPDVFVSKFFDEMDADQDGIISSQEYKAGAMKNSDIIKGLKLYQSSGNNNS